MTNFCLLLNNDTLNGYKHSSKLLGVITVETKVFPLRDITKHLEKGDGIEIEWINQEANYLYSCYMRMVTSITDESKRSQEQAFAALRSVLANKPVDDPFPVWFIVAGLKYKYSFTIEKDKSEVYMHLWYGDGKDNKDMFNSWADYLRIKSKCTGQDNHRFTIVGR